MEEKFRIKEYNEGQEEDKEEKYRDKNKSFDDTERRTPRLIRMISRLRGVLLMRVSRTLNCSLLRELEKLREPGCSSHEVVWMTE